jgi:hypothetical protein
MILVKIDSSGRYVGYVDTPDNVVEMYLEDGYFKASVPPNNEYVWVGEEWVHSPNMEKLRQEIISKRNRLLTNSDWTQLPDVPIETREVWVEYRQKLRDITDQSDFPESVEWPQSPLDI